MNGPSNTQATSMQIHYNSIVDNGEWGLHVMNGVWVNTSNNWWGTNAPVYTRSTTAPSSPSDIFEERSGTQHVTYNPWLFFRISTNTPIYNGDTSTVTADLTHDNNNNITPGTVPDGTLVTFALINGPYGSLTTPLNRPTTAGQATIIFTANDPNAPHTQNVNAIVDHQIVTSGIVINPKANVYMTKTGNGPLNVGQTGTFTITLTNNGPNAAQNIQVTDPVPTGFTAGTPSTGTYVGNIWTIPSLANGATATLTFNRVMTNADAGTTKTNTASETQDTYNPTPITDKTATINVNNAATVVMTKTGNGPLNVGQTGTFTITLTNNGPNAAQNIQVTDPVPTGFTAGTPSTGTYVGNIWTIPSLANGATATLTFNRVMTNADAGTTKTNTASETQDTYNPTPITDKTATINVNNAVLTITKTANQANYNAGNNVDYTIQVTNNGPNTATNVVVTDTVPAGLTYVSSLGGSYNPVNRVITWNIPSLDKGVEFDLDFTASVDQGTQGQTIANTAFTHNDQNPTDVTSQPANIHVNNAVLTVTKTTTETNYNVGDNVVYNIDVLNNGPDAATNVVVTDTLPAGLTYVSNTLGGIYNAGTRTITWNLANLANGAHFIPTFTATVNTGTEGQSLINTASTHNDQNPTDVISEPAVIHVNNATLTVTKTAAQANYNVGDTAVYNMDVLNNGPNTAINVVVTDILPAGLTYLSSTLGGVYDSATRTVTWTIASLDNGVHFLATVSATVTADAAGKTLTNTLQAKDDQMVDPVSTTSSIYVPSAALELTKTVNNSTPKINNTVFYTLIVQNHGPDAATSVKVTDVVPTVGLKFVGVDSINYGTYDPTTGVWTIGDFPANSVAKLVLRFTVTRAGTIENNAKVTSLTYDPNLYPTEASVTINVQKPVPVNPIPTVGAKTIAMQHTGLPIGALILAVIMLFTGIVLPRRKN